MYQLLRLRGVAASHGLRRLTEAWTPASANCATNPSVAGLGGPAPYWTSYSYNQVGNRLSETRLPTDDAVVELIWLAIADIEDKRARAREKERGLPRGERTAPGRLIEDHVTQGWKQAINALSIVFEGRIPENILWLIRRQPQRGPDSVVSPHRTVDKSRQDSYTESLTRSWPGTASCPRPG